MPPMMSAVAPSTTDVIVVEMANRTVATIAGRATAVERTRWISTSTNGNPIEFAMRAFADLLPRFGPACRRPLEVGAGVPEHALRPFRLRTRRDR